MGMLKKTTGLMGLAVNPNPHHTLGALYGKILRTLQKMPEESIYRKSTEQIVRERAAVLKELNLARKMLNWKPWEPLVSKPPKGQWDWPPTSA
ncbi:unnamed protein product [Leptidea sinapis]|uniref:NADH dehydrogenase [ubiquinone] 1 alpha subcomplex subunit 5 n=1 Tax=Leptidea sinapis TaxID=189913 RepID=A0A5E4QAA6_9NEOP|nr:unnamed protein product [Leptidea sinapis]